MKTTKITRPHLCNICGGSGITQNDRGQNTVPPNCIACNGTGLLQIEEVVTEDSETTNGIKDDMNLTATELRQEYYTSINTLSETAKERDAFKAEAASWREELIATTNREQKTSARADAAEAVLRKEIERLKPYEIDYLGVRSLCGLKDDDSTVTDFIDALFGRAEAAEAALVEVRETCPFIELYAGSAEAMAFHLERDGALGIPPEAAAEWLRHAAVTFNNLLNILNRANPKKGGE